jgi:hypothetical protein
MDATNRDRVSAREVKKFAKSTESGLLQVSCRWRSRHRYSGYWRSVVSGRRTSCMRLMIAMSKWCYEGMRCAHAVDDSGLPFCVQYSVIES